MKFFWMILALILVLIYIISPIDSLPDMIPLLGWLDDTLLVGLLAYYLRYKRLPGFIYRLSRLFFQNSDKRSEDRAGASTARDKSHADPTEKGPAAAKDPHEILGVKPGATLDEIQAAYRAAAQQYHPDKVAHLGDELQELAQKKFVEIQEAYEALCGRHS